MSLLTPFRDLEKQKELTAQAEQARNYFKHQCELLKRKVAEQDRQLEGSFQAFKFAEARAVMAEMENARLREKVAHLEQRLRELMEDEHRRTGMIAS